LKAFVDRRWPAEPRQAETAPGESAGEDGFGRADWGRAQPRQTGENIRYLLARRLARAHRLDEARNYYPEKWRPLYEQLRAALNHGENSGRAAQDRAQAYFEAAQLTRKLGLELVGTEVEPDWRIHAGDYEEGVTVADRANLRSTNALAASEEELGRAAQHAPAPGLRWHYRRTASALAVKGAQLLREADSAGLSKEEWARTLFESAELLHQFDRYATEIAMAPDPKDPPLLARYPSAILAWKAAQLLPNNADETARVLCRGGSWIKNRDPKAADLFYKALVRRCRKTEIGAEADRLRWFPLLDQQGNLKAKTPPPAGP
jgi:hypothetical protein